MSLISQPARTGVWSWLVRLLAFSDWSILEWIQRIGYPKAAYITHIVALLPEEEEEGDVLREERIIIYARGHENVVTLAKQIMELRRFGDLNAP